MICWDDCREANPVCSLAYWSAFSTRAAKVSGAMSWVIARLNAATTSVGALVSRSVHSR